MLKKVKGLIVQDNEKKIKVLTSVFSGSGVDENIKTNIIKGLENFGFTKQEPGKKSSPDFENYAAEITGNTVEEIKFLQKIIDTKKRHEVILGMINGKTAVIKTNSIPADQEEKVVETEVIQSKNEVNKYLGLATFNSENKNGLSIGLIFSSKNDDSEKISDFESMGMTKMQGKEEDQWVSYSMWVNKPSEEEIDIMKNFPTEDEGKYKKRGIITLDTSNYGSFKLINNILSIEEIPEKVNSSEAEENAMM
jgi:hypothetical protein